MKQAAKSEVMSYKTLKHDSFNQFVIAPSGAGMSFSMSESNTANRKWEMQCN